MKYFFFSTLFILFFEFSYSQKDKEYLLVDSVDYQKLSKKDKTTLDSILPIYHKATLDTTKLILLSFLTENIYDETTWPKYNRLLYYYSQKFLEDSKPRSEKEIKTIKKYLASAILNFGYYALNMEFNSSKSIEFNEKALKIQEEIGDKTGAGITLNNMAATFRRLGNIPLALEYYSRSLKTLEGIKNKENIAYTINGIGLTYLDQADTAKAVEFFIKSLKLREEIGDKRGIAHSLEALGNISLKQGNFKKAIEYFQRCLNLWEELGAKQGIASSLQNLGSIYLLQFQHTKTDKDSIYIKGMDYLQQALKIGEEINDKRNKCSIFLSMGSNYFFINDLTKALDYSKRSLDLAKEIGYPEFVRNSADLLFKIYRKQGKWQDALFMHELFVQMHDSIFNEETQKATFEQQSKYEYEKQQLLKDAERRKELAVAEEEKKQQKIITYSIGFGLLMVVGFSIFIFNRLRITRKQKQIIEEQKQIVDQKNKHITDSINYAKRIQDSILPSREELSKYFSGYFIFFRPRDIVSGDFYWLSEQNEKAIFALADCTGHGVPGAFMSMIGNTLLNEIVNEQKISQPSEILNHLNEGIVNALHQESRSQDDGMDISICLFDKKENKIIFAGANHSMYRVQDGILQEIKGDIYSIGSMFGKKNVVFTQKEILVQKNSSLYFFTDGFPDQVGGAKGKKFLIGQLEKLLLRVSVMGVKEQEQEIIKSFESWKGEYAQLDDVLLAGIRT